MDWEKARIVFDSEFVKVSNDHDRYEEFMSFFESWVNVEYDQESPAKILIGEVKNQVFGKKSYIKDLVSLEKLPLESDLHLVKGDTFIGWKIEGEMTTGKIYLQNKLKPLVKKRLRQAKKENWPIDKLRKDLVLKSWKLTCYPHAELGFIES